MNVVSIGSTVSNWLESSRLVREVPLRWREISKSLTNNCSTPINCCLQVVLNKLLIINNSKYTRAHIICYPVQLFIQLLLSSLQFTALAVYKACTNHLHS